MKKQKKLVEAQQQILVLAQEDGLRAWRLLVVNHMLGRQFLKTKQYRWRSSELAQIAGVNLETVVVGKGPDDTENL